MLTDIASQNPAYKEEFFGPVAQVYRARDEADAVRIANDTPFGLGSYVYTTDPEQALRVADGIEAGMVWVNIVLGDGAELPFGGIMRSGWGPRARTPRRRRVREREDDPYRLRPTSSSGFGAPNWEMQRYRHAGPNSARVARLGRPGT